MFLARYWKEAFSSPGAGLRSLFLRFVYLVLPIHLSASSSSPTYLVAAALGLSRCMACPWMLSTTGRNSGIRCSTLCRSFASPESLRVPRHGGSSLTSMRCVWDM